MPEITLESSSGPLARFELGEPSESGFYDADDGALADYGGNLYLYVDGVELGSLFFFAENGRMTVTLGRLDVESGEWVEANPIGHPTPESVLLYLEST